ncbi:TniB family NTP-binding protein [Streptomyces caelestis]|uniref:TniB family NTP-binding protein n=1 Tax=Streptomyces caelestis TaxID=36816 RepID=UPI0036FB0DDB
MHVDRRKAWIDEWETEFVEVQAGSVRLDPVDVVDLPAGQLVTRIFDSLLQADTQVNIRRQPVPVAYVLVPPGATAKTLAGEFARYLGIPVTTRMTTAQITTAVCHTYTAAGVKLVLIDEIHRLNPRTSTGAEAADWLKDLTERVPATFVYAGIDVTASTVFTGVRGAQLAGRASVIDCGALPARAGDREPFRELIAALEADLDLSAHRPGSLPRLAPYLHERTAGRIGSLARLIRQAAIEAILDGQERITKTLLDGIALDHLAEEHLRPRTPGRRARPGSR